MDAWRENVSQSLAQLRYNHPLLSHNAVPHIIIIMNIVKDPPRCHPDTRVAILADLEE